MPADLLALHRLAAARGDGLRPELLELMARRAAIEADPKVITIGAFAQAGPCPGPEIRGFSPADAAGPAPDSPVSLFRKGRTACISR